MQGTARAGAELYAAREQTEAAGVASGGWSTGRWPLATVNLRLLNRVLHFGNRKVTVKRWPQSGPPSGASAW